MGSCVRCGDAVFKTIRSGEAEVGSTLHSYKLEIIALRQKAREHVSVNNVYIFSAQATDDKGKFHSPDGAWPRRRQRRLEKKQQKRRRIESDAECARPGNFRVSDSPRAV